MQAASDTANATRKFHFISGLPRSGTTLLAAILNQNPRFRAGMTSPLADIMGVVLAETSSKNDFSFAVSEQQRRSLLRGLADNEGLAHQLAEYQTRYGDWRELFRELDRINKVNKADVRRVANKVFVVMSSCPHPPLARYPAITRCWISLVPS